MSDDLFSVAAKNTLAPKKAKEASMTTSNVPELSVSDLAGALKRTLEDSFSHIRVRGELSGIKIAASGHLYGDIKDVDANINIVCWRGTMSKLSIQPEEGMEVVITGRVSSYAKSSRYQIIIEKMELAGEGALLKLLEERKKKLTAEGLFSADQKKELPFLPKRIGVVTSPTGAVIRDIMHRLKDRFPSHVVLWPVIVQGQGAAEKIASAIDGFNQLEPSSNLRPDLLIVARGGGSLEDLMAFNEEIVVRAVANSAIPIISAVGHETDTTLCDYAADFRAPTPTGAAEIAVPVRLNLMAQLQDDGERLMSGITRNLTHYKNILATRVAQLGKPSHILDSKNQTLDLLSEKLSSSLTQSIHSKRQAYQIILSKLTSPAHLLVTQKQNLNHTIETMQKSFPRIFEQKTQNLINVTRLMRSLSHENVLKRGFALVYDNQGNLVRKSASVGNEQEIKIEFANKDHLTAKVKGR